MLEWQMFTDKGYSLTAGVQSCFPCGSYAIFFSISLTMFLDSNLVLH